MRAVCLSFLLFTAVLIAGCGGSSSSSTGSGSGSGTGTGSSGSSTTSNVLPLTVNGGPVATSGSIYENAAFASATICAPGSTSNCVTIDNLLVDTGSTGLRVFDTEVSSLNLPTVNASNGSAAYDCVSFVDNSFLWGTVNKADVTLGSEKAASLPIQVISGSSTGVPTSCSNGSTQNENNVQLLGANGILGVGNEPTDCYYDGVSVCDPSSGLTSPPAPAYYTCSGTNCSAAFVTKANQVTNPVVLFPTDNNGVIVELPSATTQASLTGSLIFGIGTESNNQLSSSATILTQTCDAFTTVYDSQTYGVTNPSTCAGPESFIDSGSNGYFFPNPGNTIPTCPSSSSLGDLSDFYCPTTTENLSATNEGANGATKATNFSIGNTEQLFTTDGSDAVFPTLGGVNPTGYGFDWGLPFFYGVNVYSSIDGQAMPSGTPAAPWWAY